MPTVLLDACIPASLQHEVAGAAVTTAKSARLDGLTDSALLYAVAGRYDVLVTLDRVIALQDDGQPRPFAVVVLEVAELSPANFHALAPKLSEAIRHVMPGDIVLLHG